MLFRYEKNFKFRCYLFAFLASTVTTQVFAQQDAEPILIQVNQLEIYPDKMDQFRAVHRDSFIPASRARGLAWRLTNRVTVGNTMQVTVAIPIPNMASLENQNSPGANSVESQLALGLWSQTVKSRRSLIVTSRPDLSMESIPNTGMTTVVHFLVKPGKEPAFGRYWTDMVRPAMTKSGVVGAQMFQTTTGGAQGEFWLLVPQDGYAVLDGPGPFSGVTPEEAARLQEMGNELFITWDTQVTVVDQELSYGLPGLQP